MSLRVSFVVTLVAVLAGLLPVAGCAEDARSAAAATPAPDEWSGRLTLTGSSTVAPLASEIGKRFETRHPAVRVDVQTGGSSRGLADARRGTADVGMVSRDLGDAERNLLAHPIARDGIGLIVHRDNPVAGLSDADVVAVYTGRIRSWAAVGGHDAPITVVNKAAGRSTLELFLRRFALAGPDIRADVVIGDNQQGIKTVVANPDAIGYVSIGAAEYEVRNGAPIRLLPMDGVAATVANVRNGSFPLARPLNLVTLGPTSGLAAAFIDFAQSPEVTDLIESQYLVPPAR